MTFALAVDVGGTKAEACLVYEHGEVVPGTRMRIPTGPGTTHASLSAAIHELVHGAMARMPDSGVLAGVGIGSAGPIHSATGAISPLNMPSVREFSIIESVRSHVPEEHRSKPITLAHDGQCVAIAESWLGAGREASTMLGMVVSTGIGGGFVVDGRPLTGGSGNAGHLGQLAIAGFTAEDASALETTVERIASGPSTVRWAQDHGWTGQTGEDLADAYAHADEVAVAAVLRSATAVGAALTSAAALIDFDLVVIGGGFSRVAPDYVDLVRVGRDSTAAFPFLARADIRRASLEADSPLIGAAALILHRIIPSRGQDRE